ncbi:hypothetical protein CHL78_001860 [Romboutsia weinsteinii]|uniref:Polymerase/histidinol phosphatase N-terminal domain-containing protein n=1 Tax=Romboutsia weinsteinii TaxID=2020949 RepID=A0A371J9N6_9FIRM|nr:CehA/McbA family metallohydrolase [Romboutsia weinsteinii]RDY29471.1 hypothetical protein CHL78_001860 [Romboutsia weinsteinii]
MIYKKIVLSLIGFVIIFCSISYAIENNDNQVETATKGTSAPTIKTIIPAKCQQYIIGKPTIEAYFKDKSDIDSKSIKMYVNYEDVTENCNIDEEKITYTPRKKFKRGNQIVKIELIDLATNKNKQVYEWYFTVGTPVYNQYRGLLHSHTSASDGHGTYDDAYYMSKYKSNLDFFAITEHSNLLDNKESCSINNADNSEEWNNLIKCRDKFNQNKDFLALNGFEMTYNHKEENPIGHINVYNSDGFVYVDDKMTLENFYELLYSEEDLIGQLNHPCDKFGKFNNLKYSPHGDRAISLIEVGNGYNADMSKNIRSHDMYQLALDNGWHVAPTCNQDNHRVDFGVANEFRTVILSTDLTKDAIFDSIKKMRVYATEDKNLRIDYTINDRPMGSTLGDKAKLNFSICAIDNDNSDKIKEIQVISNKGEIIKSQTFNSNLARLDFSIKYAKNKFYYVKVIQNNDKISVTAPIWTKK